MGTDVVQPQAAILIDSSYLGRAGVEVQATDNSACRVLLIQACNRGNVEAEGNGCVGLLPTGLLLKQEPVAVFSGKYRFQQLLGRSGALYLAVHPRGNRCRSLDAKLSAERVCTCVQGWKR